MSKKYTFNANSLSMELKWHEYGRVWPHHPPPSISEIDGIYKPRQGKIRLYMNHGLGPIKKIFKIIHDILYNNKTIDSLHIENGKFDLNVNEEIKGELIGYNQDKAWHPGKNVFFRIKLNVTPLLIALLHQNLELFNTLLDNGADPTTMLTKYHPVQTKDTVFYQGSVLMIYKVGRGGFYSIEPQYYEKVRKGDPSQDLLKAIPPPPALIENIIDILKNRGIPRTSLDTNFIINALNSIETHGFIVDPDKTKNIDTDLSSPSVTPLTKLANRNDIVPLPKSVNVASQLNKITPVFADVPNVNNTSTLLSTNSMSKKSFFNRFRRTNKKNNVPKKSFFNRFKKTKKNNSMPLLSTVNQTNTPSNSKINKRANNSMSLSAAGTGIL